MTRVAATLAEKLDTPVRIAVVGPSLGEKTRLAERLGAASDLVARSVSIKEYDLPEDDAEARENLRTLSEHCDIAILCVETFEGGIAQLWTAVPDRLRDHSYLVLVSDAQTASQRAVHLSADQFQACFSLAPSTCATGSETQPEFGIARNGADIVAGLIRDIDTARSADLDYAEVLLAKFAPVSSEHDIEPVTPDEPQCQIVGHSRQDAVETALALLESLCDDVDAPNIQPQDVLQKAAQGARALSSLLTDADPVDDQLAGLKRTAQECEVMVAQLQPEATDRAAEDALTVLLQAKKEFSEVAFS
jgi:hypothetical protein